MITGCIPTEDREYCQKFIQKKYDKEYNGHATPIHNKILLEVYLPKEIKKHNLKRHMMEFVEEIPLAGNDR